MKLLCVLSDNPCVSQLDNTDTITYKDIEDELDISNIISEFFNIKKEYCK